MSNKRRSLNLIYEHDADIEDIKMPSDGTNGSHFEITVKIDGNTNNSSFTITKNLSDWFTYEIKRVSDSVKVLLKISKNLSPDVRYGSITISHNASATESKTIAICQEGSVYTLEVDKKNLEFKSAPYSEVDGKPIYYEDKEVTITTKGGSCEWYIKDIKQYKCRNNIDNQGNKIETSKMQILYDGAFTYAKNDNKLIIRSYGQIDSLSHKRTATQDIMKYVFLLSHKDVNNSNDRLIADKKYQKEVICTFDGIFNMNTYKE